jgi:hypothetical protein
MPKHGRQLLVLAMIGSVAPAEAGQPASPFASDSGPSCPYERARLAAKTQTMTISSVDDSSRGALFDPGGRSALLTP